MTKTPTRVALISLLALISPLSLRAEVKLPALFTDHMVLQRDQANTVWGTADPGKTVTIKIADHTASATAGADGKFVIRLAETKASDQGVDMTVSEDGGNAITVHDILFGEVWICSGQSNMGFELFESNNGKAEVAAADYPTIRLFKVLKKGAAEPQSDVKAEWKICTPKTAWDFSAVAYFFGRDLQKSIHVPIGLIDTSYGGTPAESWTSLEDLQSNPVLKRTIDHREDIIAAYPKKKADYEQALATWKKNHAKPTTQELKSQPKEPEGADGPHTPTALYNAMIHPLIHFGVRGAIWYQGESNADHATEYRTLFPTMIQCWRKQWNEDFPFYFVQLANFSHGHPQATEPRESTWAELREAQTMTLSTPNTGMAVIIDIGDEKNIHPKNKQEVGRRLSLIARANTYGEKIEYAGPMYKSMDIEPGRIRLHFTHLGDGLVLKDINGADHAFAIAGSDHKFVWATAKIDGASLLVSSPEISEPVAVRYDWDYNPTATLFSKTELPASPFRTDDWVAKPEEVKK